MCFGVAAGRRFLLPAFRGLTDFGELVTVATTAPNVDPMLRATPTSDPLFFALDALFILSLLNTGFDR
jgi:DNA phosphorothioation-dependent restriction protein DptG